MIETKGELFGDTFDEMTRIDEQKAQPKKPTEPEEFGYDDKTGTKFMKERRRKPTRYFVSEDGQTGKFK